jgi:sulfite reductase (NADPH) hemoprotein beta-component
VAKQIQARFGDFDYLYDLGPLEVKISGCMNACGHHHVGHIGILGVEKRGEEWYQITLGGSASGQVSLGEVIGPSVPQAAVAQTIATILTVYIEQREAVHETFLQTVRRIGVEPFRERVYATDH